MNFDTLNQLLPSIKQNKFNILFTSQPYVRKSTLMVSFLRCLKSRMDPLKGKFLTFREKINNFSTSINSNSPTNRVSPFKRYNNNKGHQEIKKNQLFRKLINFKSNHYSQVKNFNNSEILENSIKIYAGKNYLNDYGKEKILRKYERKKILNTYQSSNNPKNFNDSENINRIQKIQKNDKLYKLLSNDQKLRNLIASKQLRNDHAVEFPSKLPSTGEIIFKNKNIVNSFVNKKLSIL